MTPALRETYAEPSNPLVPSPPKVDVYRNLNNGCLSVRNFVSSHPDYGNVIIHTDNICLESVEFVVQEESQENAKQEGIRNVHAFARGVCTDFNTIEDGTRLTYKPFDDSMPDQFSTIKGRPLDGAEVLTIRVVENSDSQSVVMKGKNLEFAD